MTIDANILNKILGNWTQWHKKTSYTMIEMNSSQGHKYGSILHIDQCDTPH